MMLRHTGTYRAPVRKTDWSGFDVRTLVHAYIPASANDEPGDYLEITVNRNFSAYGFQVIPSRNSGHLLLL